MTKLKEAVRKYRAAKAAVDDTSWSLQTASRRLEAFLCQPGSPIGYESEMARLITLEDRACYRNRLAITDLHDARNAVLEAALAEVPE
jgi:hypothetical protein